VDDKRDPWQDQDPAGYSHESVVIAKGEARNKRKRKADLTRTTTDSPSDERAREAKKPLPLLSSIEYSTPTFTFQVVVISLVASRSLRTLIIISCPIHFTSITYNEYTRTNPSIHPSIHHEQYFQQETKRTSEKGVHSGACQAYGCHSQGQVFGR
jgi:hypothetical protein